MNHAVPSPRHSILQQTLQRLSDPKIWNRGFLVFAGTITAFITIFMDVIRSGDYNWLWLMPWLLTTAFCGTLGFVAWLTLRHLPLYKWFFLVNLLLGAAIGAIKNTSVNLVAGWFNLHVDDLWWFRVYGGAFMGMAFVSFYALSTGARFDHSVAIARLQEVRNQLLAHRENLAAFVETENRKLVQATGELLIPKIRKIQEMLSNRGLSDAVEELRHTIETDLRPLTKNVSGLQPPTSPNPPKIKFVGATQVRFPAKSELPYLLRPWRVLIFNSLAYALYFFLFSGVETLGLMLLAVLAEALIQFLFKQTLSHKMQKRRVVLLKLVLVGLVAVSPVVVLVTFVEQTLPTTIIMIGVILIVSLGSLYFNGYALVLDRVRENVENEIARENDVLRHENALYEQKIWVFRKSWQLVLHGTVQAALTAALTRLALKNEDDAVLAELVKQDLRRAEDALQNNPNHKIDLHRAISDLSTTWRGVCEVTVAVSERAARALKRNFETMFCVNEIMREAVSNAVRHGTAKRVDISIERYSDSTISLTARNDGIPPARNSTPGLGSITFSELTTEWTLALEQSTGRVLLSAQIPVSL